MRNTRILAPLFWTLACLSAATAAPFVAYVGNVSVHSASPQAKVMVADLGTGDVVNVSTGLSAARSPAWSPDGQHLAFEAVGEGLCDVFLCAPDGSGRQNLTATPDEWEAAPCFVDPGRIAYLVGPDRTEIWLTDLTTGHRQQLTKIPRFCKRLAASPDGRLLAVTASEKLAGPAEIYLVRTDGGGEENLTDAPAIYSPPCFTPDGASVVFAFDGREIVGTGRGLAMIPVSGGSPTLLATDAYPLAPLSVSPDGTRIAYTTSSCYHSTWVSVHSTGGESRALQVSPFHVIAWPSFSPDGRLLAFQGVYAAVYRVHVVDLETGEMRTLTPEGETGVNPVFSPR